jgi:hypothetical protein
MAIFIDLLLIIVIFATLLFAGFYPKVPAALKNGVLTLFGKETCEHEDKPFRRQKDHL